MLARINEEFGERVVVHWRAYELRPEPIPTLDPAGPYLRTTWARAVYPLAAERGMTLRLPPVQPRSRLALEAAEFARTHGRFPAMHHAIFRAFFEEGRDIGDLAVLLAIGEASGLDRAELATALSEGRHTAQVLADEQAARELGLDGVPAIMIGPAARPLHERFLISGAQPYPVVQAVVERVLRHTGDTVRLPLAGDG